MINQLLLQWHITDKCNLKCSHCYHQQYTSPEPTLSQLKSILKQYSSLLQSLQSPQVEDVRSHINLTGGEPFLHPNFLDILEIIVQRKDIQSFGILTNGSLIDTQMAKELSKLKPAFVQVSLEGSAQCHDAIRGPGNYQKTVEAIINLKKAKVKTIVSFTVHRKNFREFKYVVQIGRKLGVSMVWADRLIPQGRAEAMRDLLLSPKETREFFLLMDKYRQQKIKNWFSGTKIGMHRGLQFLAAGGRPYHCSAGETLLTLMPNGDVYPCRRMPINIGNVFETSLKEIYHKHTLLKRLRDNAEISKGCEKCLYARVCRGGLKCLAYALTGDPFNADPGCWLAEK